VISNSKAYISSAMPEVPNLMTDVIWKPFWRKPGILSYTEAEGNRLTNGGEVQVVGGAGV